MPSSPKPDVEQISLGKKIENAVEAWSDMPFYKRLPIGVATAILFVVGIILALVLTFYGVVVLPVRLFGLGISFVLWVGLGIYAFFEFLRWDS